MRGGTVLAAKLSLEFGMACSTGGGTHHAFPDRGSGYCLINDLAVTAEHLLQSGLAEKVLIVDLDVHQVSALKRMLGDFRISCVIANVIESEMSYQAKYFITPFVTGRWNGVYI